VTRAKRYLVLSTRRCVREWWWCEVIFSHSTAMVISVLLYYNCCVRVCGARNKPCAVHAVRSKVGHTKPQCIILHSPAAGPSVIGCLATGVLSKGLVGTILSPGDVCSTNGTGAAGRSILERCWYQYRASAHTHASGRLPCFCGQAVPVTNSPHALVAMHARTTPRSADRRHSPKQG
jgi:hypothetical protein